MKIKVFEVIEQGISLSFKDKTILSLIVLYSVLGIISSILMVPIADELIKSFKKMPYPLTMPVLGINEVLTIFALFVISFVILYAIVKASFESLNNRKISISNTVVSVLKKFIPIFIASIIYSITVAFGLVVLVIPGIFLSVSLFFYGHAILLNNKGIIASLKESYNIVKGNWWQVFTLYFIIIMVSMLIGFLIGILVLVLPLYLTDIISMVATFFILGLMMVIYTIVYFQLIGKEKKIDGAV